MHGPTIRLVRPGLWEDASDILRIYTPFVQNTPVTFEYDVPRLEDFTHRIETVASVYPYLVCEHHGIVTAYAYASRHMERAAFGWDVQTSIYAEPEARGTAVPRTLYAALFDLLVELGYYNAYVIITLPNPRSVRFHEAAGFAQAGVHHKTGYKGGKWHDVVWMEKSLAPHCGAPTPPRPVSALDPDVCRDVFARRSLECRAFEKNG